MASVNMPDSGLKTFDDKSSAVQAAREYGDKTTVTKKKIDGSQKWVVRCKCNSETSAAAGLELYRDDMVGDD